MLPHGSDGGGNYAGASIVGISSNIVSFRIGAHVLDRCCILNEAVKCLDSTIRFDTFKKQFNLPADILVLHGSGPENPKPLIGTTTALPSMGHQGAGHNLRHSATVCAQHNPVVLPTAYTTNLSKN